MNKVKQLLPIQELDLKIKEIKVSLSDKVKKLEPLEKNLLKATSKIEATKNDITTLKLDAKEKELKVKEFEDHITKLQTQSLSAKKNDEYQAILKQVGGLKADKMLVEDRLLEVYMKTEEYAKIQKQDEDDKNTTQKKYDQEKTTIETECSELNKQLQDLEEQRKETIKNIDAELLRVYDRILNATQDALVISIVQRQKLSSRHKDSEDPLNYNYFCGGCNVALTTQDVNALMLAKDILYCRSCSRILMLESGTDNS